MPSETLFHHARNFHVVAALARQGTGEIAKADQLLMLRGSPYLPVLHEAKQKFVPDRLRSHHGLVDVAASITHIHPATAFGRSARSGNALQPQFRFASAPFALLGVFAGWRLLADPQLLVSQAQDLARLGQYRQAVVLQKAPPLAIPDGTCALQRGVIGEIQFGSVVQDQDQFVLAHRLTGKLPVRSLDRWQGGDFLIAKVVKGPQAVPVENLVERFLRQRGDGRRRLDQTPRPPPVSQRGWTEVLLGPFLSSRAVHDDLDFP